MFLAICRPTSRSPSFGCYRRQRSTRSSTLPHARSGCRCAAPRPRFVCKSSIAGSASIRSRAVPSGGVGLVAIRERLKLVNGDSVIVSRPGEGTRVEAWVPLRLDA